MHVLVRMLTCFKSWVTKGNWRCHYFLAPTPDIMVSWPQGGNTYINMSRFQVKRVSAKWTLSVVEEKETRCCKLYEGDWIKLTESFFQSLEMRRVKETMERIKENLYLLGLLLASSANHFFSSMANFVLFKKEI